MAVNTKMIGLVVGGVLVVLGIVLMLITEPSGEEGGQASGGVSDVSEDTRPYLWWGVVALVVGIVVAAGAWFFAGSKAGGSA